MIDEFKLAKQLVARWGGNLIQPLHGTNATFFEFAVEQKKYVLRILANSKRNFQDQMAEIEWILHLKGEGILVCQSIKNLDDQYLVQTQWNAEPCYASAFSEAKGHKVDYHGLSHEFVKEWGALIARFHTATLSFQIGAYKRPEWKPGLLLRYIKQNSEHPSDVYHQLTESASKFQHLSKKRNYGLIHSDLTPGNFLVAAENEIHVFDFDDCQYNYFVYDLVVILYMASFHINPNGKSASKLHSFWRQLLSGYTTVRELPFDQLELLPEFLTFFNVLVLTSLTSKGIAEKNSTLFHFADQAMRENTFDVFRSKEWLHA